jgi:hypothetical protein
VKDASQAETTFGSIESAAEYLALLLEVVEDARRELEQETTEATAAGAERRRQAIQLATYKLTQLKGHLATSHRLLNDLRTLRRLLFAERAAAAEGQAALLAEEVAAPLDAPRTEAPKPVTRRPSAPRAEPV